MEPMSARNGLAAKAIRRQEREEKAKEMATRVSVGRYTICKSCDRYGPVPFRAIACLKCIKKMAEGLATIGGWRPQVRYARSGKSL